MSGTTKDGNDWEIDKLTDFFNSLEQANSLNTNKDSLQWLRAKNGKFTTKSGYRHLIGQLQRSYHGLGR